MLNNRLLFLSLIIFIVLSSLSCASSSKVTRGPKTVLEQQFIDNFQNLPLPDANLIKQNGIHKKFPHVAFQEAWESAVLVVMQRGILVSRLEKDRGILAIISNQPLVFLIEEVDNEVDIYLSVFEQLNKRIDDKKKIRKTVLSDYLSLSDDYFGKLATQIYSAQKWQYLYQASTQK